MTRAHAAGKSTTGRAVNRARRQRAVAGRVDLDEAAPWLCLSLLRRPGSALRRVGCTAVDHLGRLRVRVAQSARAVAVAVDFPVAVAAAVEVAAEPVAADALRDLRAR